MATSGSTDFNLTRNEIILDALTHVGAIAAGDATAAEDIAFAARELNRMVKEWQATGTHLWKTEEAIVFLVKGQASYSLGSTGDEATLSHVKTELASDAASGATSLTVDSITGIAASDKLGVVQDDGVLHWSTQSGTPTGTTLTLAAGLTAAASVDAHVYAFTTTLVRPLRMISARRKDSEDQDIPLLEWGREVYFDTPNKTAEAPPTAVYYDPQLTNGTLFVWPSPDTVNDRISLTVDIPIEDFDATSDNADFPQEWLNALTWNLAERLIPSYGLPDPQATRIERRAAQSLAVVMAFDRETGAISFAPDLTYDN